MKKLLFCSMVLGFALQANAYYTPWSLPEYRLNWGSSEAGLNQNVCSFMDSIYADLEPGTSVRVVLLSDEEKKYEELKKAQLSYKRADALLDYFREKGVPFRHFDAEMVPFHQPNRLRSSEIMSRSYRSFMSRKSESFFILQKGIAQATNQPGVAFDASFRAEEEHFTFSADREEKLVLPSGTEFVIPPACFVREDGSPLSNSSIQAHVAEYLGPAAMAMKAMTTSSHGQMLQSNGMWHIAFTQDGHPLKVAPGMHYGINVERSGDVAPMQVFTGKMVNGMIDWNLERDGKVEATTGSVPADANKKTEKTDVKLNIQQNEWNLNNRNNNTDQMYVTEEMDINSSGFGVFSNSAANRDIYEMKLNDVGWINCDAFYQVSEKTDLVVQCDTTKGLNVMLVFTKRKSVLPAYMCTEPGTFKFSNVPVGETAMVVVFKKKENGGLDKFMKTLTLGDDKTVLAKRLTGGTMESLQNDINGKMADL